MSWPIKLIGLSNKLLQAWNALKALSSIQQVLRLKQENMKRCRMYIFNDIYVKYLRLCNFRDRRKTTTDFKHEINYRILNNRNVPGSKVLNEKLAFQSFHNEDSWRKKENVDKLQKSLKQMSSHKTMIIVPAISDVFDNVYSPFIHLTSSNKMPLVDIIFVTFNPYCLCNDTSPWIVWYWL